MEINKKRIIEVATKVAAVATAVVAAVMVYKNVTSGNGTKFEINKDDTIIRFRIGDASDWSYFI